MKFAWVTLVFLAVSSSGATGQDIAAGERSWNKCRACHQVGEKARNGVGPQLNGLFGRHSGSIEGYSYSVANKNSGITWDDAVFAEYIRDPKLKIPGTKMIFAGIKSDQEVRDLIAFIRQYNAEGTKSP